MLIKQVNFHVKLKSPQLSHLTIAEHILIDSRVYIIDEFLVSELVLAKSSASKMCQLYVM